MLKTFTAVLLANLATCLILVMAIDFIQSADRTQRLVEASQP